MATETTAPAAAELAAPEVHRRRVLATRVRWFVAATITYNVVEAVVAIIAGSVASSAALVGFGLDSVVEVASAAAVAWQFSARAPETREKTALRMIAVSFFGLAGYVTVVSVLALTGTASEARHSTVGLILAAVSLAVMPVLSYGQRRAGRELGSRSAVADSKQTLLCTYLSAVLLVGLGVNTAFGWSWADPVAALVIAAVAVREGGAAWRGDTCCTTTLPRDTVACGAQGVAVTVDPTAPGGRTDAEPVGPCGDACCAPTPTTGPQRLDGGMAR